MTILRNIVRFQTLWHRSIPLIYRPSSTFVWRTNRLNNLILTSPSQGSRFMSKSSSSSSTSSTDKDGFEDLDKPIQYTTSAASEWTAERTHMGALHPDVPDYQPYVVVFSVGMLLLYFCVLREESDIDEALKKPIWQKVPGLEKQQIVTLLKYSETHPMNTDALITRLEEINELERKMKQDAKSANK